MSRLLVVRYRILQPQNLGGFCIWVFERSAYKAESSGASRYLFSCWFSFRPGAQASEPEIQLGVAAYQNAHSEKAIKRFRKQPNSTPARIVQVILQLRSKRLPRLLLRSG
jgi:hypothetical protein